MLSRSPESLPALTHAVTAVFEVRAARTASSRMFVMFGAIIAPTAPDFL